MTLRTAITNGAQLYNADDGEACLKLFTATAEHLYNMLQVIASHSRSTSTTCCRCCQP